MKILHFCLQAPFTEHYSYQDNLLTEYQHKHGHDVRIITTTKTRSKNGEYVYTKPVSKVLDNGVELVRVSVKSKIRNAFGRYSGLLKQMIEYCPDMIFIHGLCSFVPKDAIKYKTKYNPRVHIVADNHQDAWTTKSNGLFPSMSFWLFRNGWKKWVRRVDKIYGTTSWRITFAHEYYGIPEEKLDVLVMGIDSDGLPNDREGIRRKLRKDNNINDCGFVFISGGKIDKDKHILETLAAFSQIVSDDIYFLVFGSVSDDIQTEFYELVNRDKRISFLGYLDSPTIKNYLIAADFGVFPGRHSVLWEEAIGCGLPCLFHRYEEIDHTEVCDNCVCIEQPSIEAIRSVMERVISDKVYYDQMKKNSEKAAEQFSYHAIAEKSLECCYER